MKRITLLVVISFVIVLISGSKSIAQYNIPEIQGIPLISYDTAWEGWTEEDYKTMKDSAGVDILISTNLSSGNLQRLITGPGLYSIPQQTISQQSPEIKNWIYYYSEGRYTNWEAEGTDPADGDASIYYKNNIASFFQEGSIKGVATNDYAGYDTIIYGPIYKQEVRYLVTDTTIIEYLTDYKLKLTNTVPRQEDPQPLPSDEICRLQVTVSDIFIDTTLVPPQWVKETTPIQDILLRRENFNAGNWETKSITYDLANLDNKYYEKIVTKNGVSNFAYSVEFKIIWLGDPNSKLYVDNIILSDIKGRQIRQSQFQDLIRQQDNADYISDNYADYIKAWIGRDEPESIDMFEPIRIISDVLNNHNQGARPLIMNLSSTWNGRFGNSIPWKNSNYVVKSEEFVKRTKNTHIWQNSYLFDMPFKVNGDPWWVDDYRDWNIRIYADSILSRINKADPLFGQLIMCGMYDLNLANVSYREIVSKELSYACNLSLLYGAKSLVLFGYYGNENPPYKIGTGLINWDFGQKNKTDKFYFVKDVLSPRLKGLFGKTLKGLNQVKQYRSIDALYPESTTPYEFVNYIQAGGGLYDTCLIELGIFQEPTDPSKKYFMPLNRYYSNKSRLTFGLRYLTGYNNWKLTDYVDTTSVTLLATQGTATFIDTIYPGDANLYSIHPVVKDGGQLLYNETIFGIHTLQNKMTIENGATLTISGNYNCLADITIKSGGKIETINGGTINFSNGSKLIVDGAAQLSGTSSNKLNLNFSTPQNENGVVVTETGTLTMTHCSVTNAVNGIKSSSSTGRTIIQNVNFVNCSNSAVTILGQISDEESTPPPQVKNCVINIPTPTGSQTVYGINATNLGEIEISSNTIRNTKCGIFLSQVGQAYVLNNNISSTTPEMPGLLMVSSAGDVRINTITNHSEAIYLASSSPNIGYNFLYNNKYHGLYSANGSNPNMIYSYAGTPPAYYIFSGYNYIYENGGYYVSDITDFTNDGSEIFISNSLARINNGCNLIYDNRLPVIDPVPGDLINTQILINGTLSQGGRVLMAENNFWDVHTLYPLSTRFGSLNVDYEPYRTTPCELPQSGDEYILSMNSVGEVVDTVYSNGEIIENPTTLESLYSEAEEYFRAAAYDNAKIKYETIILGEDSVFEKLKAYERLYTIGKITSEEEGYFNGLQNIYNNAISAQDDSLLNKMLTQKVLLSDVSKQNYASAIAGFDNIIQQNPESEEALFAEIDIITTSLLVDTLNTQLGKLGNTNYLVKNSFDYMNKLNSILNKHFGIVEENNLSKIIPTDYSLYQNYPNPFNPSTTIKYDLPKDGNAELIVYDILGRKITQLVNEYRSAGSYEHRFDASDLASGIYIYQLKAGEFITSKKMMLVK